MPIQKRSKRVARIQNGLKIKDDCFAYDKDKQECTVLLELLCMHRKCSFYKPRRTKK